MLLSLRSDHKEHLALLTNQPVQGSNEHLIKPSKRHSICLFTVVVDFCKLAIDFLQNGPNLKLYTVAAQKLAHEQDAVQNCVYGLVNLLLLSCRHKVGVFVCFYCGFMCCFVVKRS